MDFSQHTVLITGASSGIGRAFTFAFHNLGAQVVAAGRNPTRLANLARECPGITTFAGDLTVPTERARLLTAIESQAPKLSLLVHNAAVQYPANHVAAGADPTTRATQLAQVRAEIALNTSAPVELTLALMPRLQAAPHAAIVFITSGLALVPKAESAVYCATKAFLRSFAQSLRHQCEAHAPQVHVMEVLPPLVDTPMTAGRGRNKLAPEAVVRATLAGLQRHAREVDVGKVRLLRWLVRLAPTAAERLMRRA